MKVRRDDFVIIGNIALGLLLYEHYQFWLFHQLFDMNIRELLCVLQVLLHLGL